jgi:hypothetical protein
MYDQAELKALAIEFAACLPPAAPRANPATPAFEWYDHNLGALTAIEQTARAKAMRRILDIASRRGWGMEITRACDRCNAHSPAELTDDAVFKLLARMERFEDAAESCCDLGDDFPAR